MLKNLKSQVDPRITGKFNFGSTDAWDDELLESCFCEIEPINNFLDGNKELLVGAKGAGKSAIFRLLSEGKKSFVNPKKLKQIVIPINEVMEYSAVRTLVNERLGSLSSLGDNEFFYFWEVYVLYRILKVLEDDHVKIFSKLNEDAQLFMSHFVNNKAGFIDFLKGIKGTAGIKLDVTTAALPLPDFYMSAESVEKPDTAIEQLPFIRIDSLKADICKKLNEHKHAIYVLVDNLDDFASREEFEAQKLVIQGLVETCKYYTKFPEIKIKASLRPELYEKLNFAKLGGRDKIEPRSVHIKWKDDDIRRFIGERLIVNITRHCVKKKKHIQIEIAEKELYRPHRPTKGFFVELFRNLLSLFEKEVDIRDARTVDLKDMLYREVITSVFPRQIKHRNSAGKIIDKLDIFEYLSSHFSFAENNATPRIYMRYLEKVFSIANESYSKNEPKPVSLDSDGEYPLIKRNFMLTAYSQLQEEVRKNCISSVDYAPWKNNLSILFEKQGKKPKASFRVIRRWINEDDDVKTKEFLAYCRHLGILHCENCNSTQEQRIYHFPVLFQKV